MHPKILNVNLIYFQLINFCNCRIPNWHLYKKIGPYVFVISIPQFIWQDLVIAWKSSKGEKSMYYLLEFDEWTETAIEESVLQKGVFFKTVALQSIKLFVLSKSLKKNTVKRLSFIKVADLWSATLIRTGHFQRNILIRLGLI